MLTFSKKVKQAYNRYDFENLFIIGPQGSGKTTYAMLVLYEIYGDWDKVLHYTVFDPREILPELKMALKSGKRIPVILFDDAGMHLSKYLFSIDRESREIAMWINALFNVIRTICAGVIFTSPDMDVLKELRKKSWWVGEPRIPPHCHESCLERHMVLYKKRIMATGMVYTTKRAIDTYRLDLIPDDVREQYEEKRKATMEPMLEKLERLMSKSNKEKETEIEIEEEIEV